MKWVKSFASTTTAKTSYVWLDSDPFCKDGSFMASFTDKLKELVDLYYLFVREIQKIRFANLHDTEKGS